MTTKLFKAEEKLTAEQIKEILIKNGFKPEQFSGTDSSYLPAQGKFTGCSIDKVENKGQDPKFYVRLDWKSGKEEGTCSLGRINAYGRPSDKVELTPEMVKPNSKDGSLYITGSSINSHIPNSIELACAKLIGRDFKREEVKIFSLPYDLKTTDFDKLKESVTHRVVYKVDLV